MPKLVVWESIASTVGGGGRGLFRSVGALNRFGDGIPGADSRVVDPMELFWRAIACGSFPVMTFP